MKHPTPLVARPIDRTTHPNTHPLRHHIHLLDIKVYAPDDVQRRLKYAQDHSHPRPRIQNGRVALTQFFLTTLFMCTCGIIVSCTIMEHIPKSLPTLILLSTTLGALLSSAMTIHFHSLTNKPPYASSTPARVQIVVDPITYWLGRFDIKAELLKHQSELLARLPHVTFYVEHAGSEYFLVATHHDERYYIGHWRGQGRTHTHSYCH